MRKRILGWLLEPILNKISYLYAIHLLNPRIRELENTVEILWERKGTQQQEFVQYAERLQADMQQAFFGPPTTDDPD